MNKIIIHWTGGANQPCTADYEAYHFLINKDGIITNGKFSPEDNLNCYDGKYAKHCGGGNTGSIGIGLCGMYVPNNTPVKKTKYPLTKIQLEKCFCETAKLAKKYKIPVDAKHVMTHYEFGLKNPNTTSRGKIDIIYLSPYPELAANKIGDFFRNKVKWYLNKV